MAARRPDRTCVVFGAGALGLGFLGPELSSDYAMVYVDIPQKADVLDSLTREGRYTLNEAGPAARPVTVAGARGMSTADPAAVQSLLDAADLVFTAVGEPNLAKVAPTFAEAVKRRRPARPLRILCCENGLDIAKKCRAHIEGAVGEKAGGRLIVGDTVMGRMCKIVSPPEGGLLPVAPGLNWGVAAEPFFGIPVPRHAMDGLDQPGAAFQVMSEAQFVAQEDVKMLAHNGLHAFMAFLGTLRGRKFFCELREDPQIMALACGMLHEEVGPALLRKHGAALDRNFWFNYAPTIVRRITCPGLHDDIARGTRGAMRKLEPWERLVGGLRTIAGQKIVPRTYATGLAAAILVAQRTGETRLGFRDILTQHCGLREDAEGDLLALCDERRRWVEREFGVGG